MKKFWFALLLSCVTSSFSAAWYVDNAAVQSNNSGTTWANAWKSFASIVWGTGGVQPGDTVYISGGSSQKVYNEPFRVGTSGRADAWVTVASSTDAGHNGRVVIDGGNVNTDLGGFICGANYCRVTGMPNTNIVVANWVTSTTDREKGIGFYAGIPSHHIIEGICISNANNGFYYNGSADIEIRNCLLTGIRGDYAFRCNGYVGPLATDFERMRIHHNTVLLNADFVGGNGGPDGVGCANGVTLHDNVFRCVNGPVTLGQHPDGIQSLGGYVKVYNNYFANFLNAGIKFEPSAPMTEWRECYAYNNVIVVDDPALTSNTTINGKGIELGSGTAMKNVINVIVANNTFVDLLGLAVNGGAGTWPVTSLIVENNAIYNCGKNGSLAGAMGPTAMVFNYNQIEAGTDGRTRVVIDALGNGATYATFTQAFIPIDTILFARYTPRTPGNDFHMKKRLIGVNLSNYFGTDKDGLLRPTTGAWTIGAYEFDGPLPPNNFRRVLQ
jgi:hypothetical protein